MYPITKFLSRALQYQKALLFYFLNLFLFSSLIRKADSNARVYNDKDIVMLTKNRYSCPYFHLLLLFIYNNQFLLQRLNENESLFTFSSSSYFFLIILFCCFFLFALHSECYRFMNLLFFLVHQLRRPRRPTSLRSM